MITAESAILNVDTQAAYTINGTESSHSFGTRTGGNVTALWSIQGNALEVKGFESTSTTRIIDSVYYFKLESLRTEEKEYTNFKYIQ